MWKYFLLIFLISNNLFAQRGQDSFERQIEEIMKAREEMMKALMDDSMSGDMEKRMEEMMKRFESSGNFGFGQMEDSVIGEYDWAEDAAFKTLKIKVKQIKDKPLDIKIQNNEIKIKGDVETTRGEGKNKIVQKMNFEKTFSIPVGVDKTSPEFLNGKDGFMEIKFKKLAGSKSATPKAVQPSTKKEKTEIDRIPVAPNNEDLSI